MKSYTDVLHQQDYPNSWASSSEYFCWGELSSLEDSENWNLLFSCKAEMMWSATVIAQLVSFA